MGCGHHWPPWPSWWSEGLMGDPMVSCIGFSTGAIFMLASGILSKLYAYGGALEGFR